MDQHIERYQRELKAARMKKVRSASIIATLVLAGTSVFVYSRLRKQAIRDAESATWRAKDEAERADRKAPVPTASLDEARKVLRDALALVTPIAEPRIGAVLDAEERLEPHPELGACPRDLSKIPVYELMKITSTDGRHKTGKPRFLDALERELASLETPQKDGTRLGGNTEGTRIVARAKEAAAAASPPRFDLAFSLELEARSEARGNDTFGSGALAGTAFLYDYETRRVECAARFAATNSASIKIYESGTVDSAGYVDLMKNALQEVVVKLVRVGPRPIPVGEALGGVVVKRVRMKPGR